MLLLASASQSRESFSLAQTLRTAGISVIVETLERARTSSVTWAAQEARRRGLSRVLVYEQKKGVDPSVLLLELSGSSRKPRQTRVALQALPQRLRAEIHGDF